MHKFYKSTDAGLWTGRVDSESNFDAFRWHQWVEILDLNDEILNPMSSFSIGIIGYRGDKGVKKNKGRIGSSGGPISIRKELMNLPCNFKNTLKIYDCGDIICDDASIEESQQELSNLIERMLELNIFPIVIGGSHEIAFGHFSGIKKYENKKIGIINFDAHFDMRPCENGGTSGTMFRQISDIEKEDFLYYVLGIQKRGNTVELFKTAKLLGVNYDLASDILNTDIWKILESLDKFIQKSDKVYITICADVFSSSFAPGVSASQPLGLDPEKVIKILKYIFKSKKVVSFDIAEVSPRFDQDHVTSRLASTIIFAVINTLAEINDFSIESIF